MMRFIIVAPLFVLSLLDSATATSITNDASFLQHKEHDRRAAQLLLLQDNGCCEPDAIPLCLIGVAACCPDGTWSCPDGNTGLYPCSYTIDPDGPICDACCDPLQEPGVGGNPICFEGHACCPDGTWSCSIGDGKTFPCGDDLVVNPDGDVCEEDACCDPLQEPGVGGNPICFEGHACCPDGTWSCSIGDGKTFPCGDDLVVNPNGAVCPEEKCCDKDQFPLCLIGTAMCCPETGTWACPNGDTDQYNCGDEVVTNPDGEVCDDACCDPLKEPGTNGNPLCFEGHACCPDGTWTCSIGDGVTFSCSGELVKNPNGDVCPDEKCCEKDQFPLCLIGTAKCCPETGTWACPNGDTDQYPCGDEIVTNPNGEVCPVKKCCEKDQFPLCLVGTAKCCPETGTWACPNGDTVQYPCGDEVVTNPSGKVCDDACCDPQLEPGTNGNPLCFEGHACCPDGTWTCSIGDGVTFSCSGELVKNPNGDVCPDEKCCEKDQSPLCLIGTPKCCPKTGTWACPNGDTDQYPCGDEIVTNPSGKICPEEKCCEKDQFPLCLVGTAKCCPETGTWACRNGDTDQYPCGDELVTNPNGAICDDACCDPLKEPGVGGNPICFEGHACCPDGTWSCSIGDGVTFPCGGVNVQKPNGDVCPEEKCCEKDLFPLCLIGTAQCCPETGTWVCPNGDTDQYKCGDKIVTNPGGEICDDDACCDPVKEPGVGGNPICFEGHACCPDGTWSCSIGDGVTFPCGGTNVQKPNGDVCPEQKCCDKEDFPLCLIGTAQCCPETGTWVCPNGDTDQYKCGDQFITNPDGEVCVPEKCCDKGQFPLCLIGTAKCCPETGTWACPNGSTDQYNCGDKVVTNPDGDSCCCDPLLEPGANGNPICFEGHACCPDGSWSCSIGDGKTFPCGDDLVVKPDGDVCENKPTVIQTDVSSVPIQRAATKPVPVPPIEPCCDPNLEPGSNGNPFCFEGHACCPDGTWSCSIGDGVTFPCGGVNVQNPNGKVCDDSKKCCDNDTFPLCLIGTAKCCPEGEWACPNGNTNQYPCALALKPQGPICKDDDEPWVYTEPEWWDVIYKTFSGSGVRVKQCSKRQYPPKDGESCSRKRSKACFFGNREECTYPTSRCDCNDGAWSCGPVECPP